MSDRLCGNCGWGYPVREDEPENFVRCAVEPPKVFMSDWFVPFRLRLMEAAGTRDSFTALLPGGVAATLAVAKERTEEAVTKLVESVQPVAYDPRCRKDRPGCRYWKKERVQEEGK